MVIAGEEVSTVTPRSMAWKVHALCEGVHPSVFFTAGRKKVSVWARRLCRECPVRIQCLLSGWDEEYGIWGGLIPEERHILKQLIEEYPALELNELLWGFDEPLLAKYDMFYGWDIPALYARLVELQATEDDERRSA